jgi:hypothetical protein
MRVADFPLYRPFCANLHARGSASETIGRVARRHRRQAAFCGLIRGRLAANVSTAPDEHNLPSPSLSAVVRRDSMDLG